ncbi:hypothetical protein M5K25_020726 [Dendrobium thyrsiflorum]|uniref:Uncharacterized protein n=1 Tax=Dendrobium thyrsiflorum TaxID=117978 RepID=A0ABD0UBB6_DENTH
MATLSSSNPWTASKPTDLTKSVGFSGLSSSGNSRSFKDVVAGGSSSSSPKLDLVQISYKSFPALMFDDKVCSALPGEGEARPQDAELKLYRRVYSSPQQFGAVCGNPNPTTLNTPSMANRRSNRLLGASQFRNQSITHGRQVSASFHPGGQNAAGEGTSAPSLEDRIRKMEESQNEILQLLREPRRSALAPLGEIPLSREPMPAEDVLSEHLNVEVPPPPPRRRPRAHQDNELADTASSTHPSQAGRQPLIPPGAPGDLDQPHVVELPHNALRYELRRLPAARARLSKTARLSRGSRRLTQAGQPARLPPGSRKPAASSGSRRLTQAGQPARLPPGSRKPAASSGSRPAHASRIRLQLGSRQAGMPGRLPDTPNGARRRLDRRHCRRLPDAGGRRLSRPGPFPGPISGLERSNRTFLGSPGPFFDIPDSILALSESFGASTVEILFKPLQKIPQEL